MLKYFIFILIIIAVHSLSFGQYLNEVKITESGSEIKYCYRELNGSVYSIGTFSDTNVTSLNYSHIEFKKYNEDYNEVIKTRYTDSLFLHQGFYGMEYLDGFWYHSGIKYSLGSAGRVGFIMKFDTLGNRIWEVEYDSLYHELSTGLLAVSDTVIYAVNLAVNPKQTGLNDPITWIYKLDTSGNILWDLMLQNVDAQPQDMITTSDGGLLVSTSFQGASSQDLFIKTQVYKINPSGNIIWQRTLGKNYGNHILGFKELSNGNLLGYGYSEPILNDDWEHAWLVELNPTNGQVTMDTTYILSAKSSFQVDGNVIEKNNMLFIMGEARVGTNAYKATLTCLTQQYEILWTRMYGERGTRNYLYNIFEKDGYFHLQGVAHPDNTHPTFDEWFLAVDNLGCDDAVCTVGLEPKEVEGFLIYPNPSSGKITILIEDYLTVGFIEILDLSGKIITKFQMDSSYKTISLDDLDNGVYLIKFSKSSSSLEYVTRKLIIQR